VQHYLLIYHLKGDYLERRSQFREAHLAKAKDATRRGDLVIAGALAGPADMAILFFKGESPEAAERFATDDPYVHNGLVERWEVRRWNTVVGTDAAQPA